MTLGAVPALTEEIHLHLLWLFRTAATERGDIEAKHEAAQKEAQNKIDQLHCKIEMLHSKLETERKQAQGKIEKLMGGLRDSIACWEARNGKPKTRLT